MYFHGMRYKYLLNQYPILSPRLTVLKQNNKQRLDRQHLIEQFGFEPVHFLESSNTYSFNECLQACFAFGDVVLVFIELQLPFLQLSEHEVGVPVADTRKAKYLFVKEEQHRVELQKLFPQALVVLVKKIKYN